MSVDSTIVVAGIAAVPATIAALGAWKRSADTDRKVDTINRAVNHQAEDEPTLVQKVDQIAAQVKDVDIKVTNTQYRLTQLERKVG